MAYIIWQDDYSVNVEIIDNQHKKIIELINKLQEAMLKKQTKDVLGEILNELIGYAALHFSTEEKYFKEFNYSETEAHIKEHIDFVNSVTKFNDDFKKGRLFVSMKLFKFLKSWLVEHIQVSDKKYTTLFNEKGLV